MSTPNPNVEKLRIVYQRWHDSGGTSVQDWLNLMHDGIQLRSIASAEDELPFASGRRGKEDAYRYFQGLVADWLLVRFHVERFISEGDWVVALCDIAFQHRKTGKMVETRKCDVYRFQDGLIIEGTEFFDTAKAIAASQS